jgi:hypothetical protein
MPTLDLMAGKPLKTHFLIAGDVQLEPRHRTGRRTPGIHLKGISSEMFFEGFKLNHYF